MVLEEVKGIGEKTLKLIERLKIYTISDLLMYYPYKYNFYHKRSLEECINEEGVIYLRVLEKPKVSYFKIKASRLYFRGVVEDKIINVNIFNRQFLIHKIIPGLVIACIGKYDKYNNTFNCNEINFNLDIDNKIEPVYHLVSGISSKQISNIIKNLFDYKIDIEDYIPSILSEKYKFIPKLEAIKNMHFPIDITSLKQSKLRLIYEEFFEFTFKINYLKNKRDHLDIGISREVNKDLVTNFINTLKFKLTVDQEKAIWQIYEDLTTARRMNRLILGDVGSGKTIVSIIAMYINYLSNYESCLMAPTEVLAIQHYKNIKELLPNVNIYLLVGSLKAKEKEKIRNNLRTETNCIVVATHAILNEKVSFNNLGLVITDEQHRFGVRERSTIENKGLFPDIIYMSATPIPRTYALCLYGDMDISFIKTKPSGRKVIITKVFSEKEIKNVLEKIYEELKAKHQIYVVAPLIEEGNLKNNVVTLEKKFNEAFGSKYTIGILHGKMASNLKEKVLSEYKEGKIDILISTTVIEVGVDISNATMMVIYNAEFFGLATLHQLRGRVGRSDIQSYCYLISNSDTKRLKVLEASNDGFYISEQDFKMRGQGDLFGERQSGDMNFKIANIKKDFKILEKCKEDSLEYLQNFDGNKLYIDIMDKLSNNN